MEAVSDLADVPTATVYRLFSSKLGILKAVLDVAIAGDHADVPMADRRQVRTLADDPRPREQIAGFVELVGQVNQRIAPLYRILVSAAGTDPDAGALLDELTRQRQQGQRTIARSLARAGALRPELRERDAADLIHALMSPELYRLLVIDRSWSTERYERWLAETLQQQLLRPEAPPDVRTRVAPRPSASDHGRQ